MMLSLPWLMNGHVVTPGAGAPPLTPTAGALREKFTQGLLQGGLGEHASKYCPETCLAYDMKVK